MHKPVCLYCYLSNVLIDIHIQCKLVILMSHDLDNQDGVITHLELDILECEIKWDLERKHHYEQS